MARRRETIEEAVERGRVAGLLLAKDKIRDLREATKGHIDWDADVFHRMTQTILTEAIGAIDRRLADLRGEGSRRTETWPSGRPLP